MSFSSPSPAESAPKKPRRTQRDLAHMPDLVERAFYPDPVPHPIGIPKEEPIDYYRGDEADIEEDTPPSPPRKPAPLPPPPPPPIMPERRAQTPSPLRSSTLPWPPEFVPGEIPNRREEIPELPPLDTADTFEQDPAEISGPRSIPPVPPELDRGTEAHIQRLHQDIARLHQDHTQVLQNLTNIVQQTAAERRRTYEPLQEPPPQKTNWVVSLAKNAASGIKRFWEKVTGRSSSEEIKPSDNPRKTWEAIESVEQSLRDLPTMLLTGKTPDGSPLDRRTLVPTLRALETRTDVLTRSPKTTNQALETRRRAVTGELPSAIQSLARSPEALFELSDLEPEQEGDFLVLTNELRKRIYALQATADTGRDTKKRELAQTALQKLQKITGGISTEQKIKRANLTCEAALRLPFVPVDSLTRQRLSKEYQQRLAEIQRALQLQGGAKEALDAIYYDLAEDTEPEHNLPLKKAA